MTSAQSPSSSASRFLELRDRLATTRGRHGTTPQAPKRPAGKRRQAVAAAAHSTVQNDLPACLPACPRAARPQMSAPGSISDRVPLRRWAAPRRWAAENSESRPPVAECATPGAATDRPARPGWTTSMAWMHGWKWMAGEMGSCWQRTRRRPEQTPTTNSVAPDNLGSCTRVSGARVDGQGASSSYVQTRTSLFFFSSMTSSLHDPFTPLPCFLFSSSSSLLLSSTPCLLQTP